MLSYNFCMEKAEIGRLKGRELVEKVNSALDSGLRVDANAYFEAVTEGLDFKALKRTVWPSRQAMEEFRRSIGSSSVLNENNSPIRDTRRRNS